LLPMLKLWFLNNNNFIAFKKNTYIIQVK